MFNFNNFKSILCLNGRLPDPDWFSLYPNLILIAADGAGNKLIQNDIFPHFIIGDLDSLDQQYLIDPRYKNINIINILDQDHTDFEKCLIEMQNKSLFPSLVLGISGGEIDHAIYNLNCFMRHAKNNLLIFLDIDENKKFKFGIPVFDEKKIVDKIGKKISLLPFPEATVSTKGLKWELTNVKLSVSKNSSVRNIVVNQITEIKVHNGNLLVILDC